MTKIEEKLKEFGFLVEKRRENPSQLLLFKANIEGNFDIEGYYATITLVSDDEVLFNEEIYNSTRVSDLDFFISEYNKTLPYPAFTYHPDLALWAAEEKRVHWYLTKELGFKYINRDTYVLEGGFIDSRMLLLSINWKTSKEENRGKRFTVYAKHQLKEEGSWGGWSYVICDGTRNFKKEVCSLISSNIMPKMLSMNQTVLDLAPKFLKEGVTLRVLNDVTIDEGGIVTNHPKGGHTREYLIKMKEIIEQLLKE